MSTSIPDPSTEAERWPTTPDAPRLDDPSRAAPLSAAGLAASGALDTLFEQIDSGRVQLSGAGGLLPELIKAVLERGLQAELTGHLGYEKGDPAACTSHATVTGRSRRGSSPRASAASAGSTR